MTTINHDVFHKFKNIKIPPRQEGDGHERQVEVREDEEQSVKLQEIIDLLVAAGYFRARIKGLTPFDKVVGGMTWCIESCNVDVDVDLLFQENSTIGQKIALTEKIVAVLPKLKCPHQIEPHQIQGLDFIHIFPVIQWLVKRSMEFREEMSVFVRSYAINQFNKEFPIRNTNKTVHKKILENVETVNEVYRPHRYYRRKNAPPPDLQLRVQITLLEYGLQGDLKKKTVSNDANGLNVSDGSLDEHLTEQFLKTMITTNEDHKDYLILNKEDEELLQKHYESLSTELETDGVKLEEKQIFTLSQQKIQLKENYSNLLNEKEKLDNDFDVCSKSLEEIKKKIQEAKQTLIELEKTEVKSPKSVHQEVEELVIINDNIRAEESKFRENCKQQLAELQKSIEQAKVNNGPTTDLSKISSEINDKLEKMKVIRLQLAKKNRNIAALQRQLDEVPNRAELAQYQRRFLELYNQVAAKHKETKQYYTLYNTLEDTKAYMKKELSLLNSISENYPEAMQTMSGKEEFLKQLDSILDMVRQSKRKVEARLLNEKRKRDELSQVLQGFIEQQRKYVGAVRQLSIECRKYELLVAQQTK